MGEFLREGSATNKGDPIKLSKIYLIIVSFKPFFRARAREGEGSSIHSGRVGVVGGRRGGGMAREEEESGQEDLDGDRTFYAQPLRVSALLPR